MCGVVASTKHVSTSKGRPTFLNLDKPYPDQPFTVVIWAMTGAVSRHRPRRPSTGEDLRRGPNRDRAGEAADCRRDSKQVVESK